MSPEDFDFKNAVPLGYRKRKEEVPPNGSCMFSWVAAQTCYVKGFAFSREEGLTLKEFDLGCRSQIRREDGKPHEILLSEVGSLFLRDRSLILQAGESLYIEVGNHGKEPVYLEVEPL